MINIYRLKDPVTETVCYVGQTTRPLVDRLREHIQTFVAFKDNPPVIELIEQCEADDVKAREAYWINHYRSINPTMLNTHLGGKRRGKNEPKEISESSHKGTFIGAYISDEELEKIKLVEKKFDSHLGDVGRNRSRAIRWMVDTFYARMIAG